MEKYFLEHYGIVKISGKDNFKFLQGQLTCNVENLNKKSTILGGYANLKGRLESLFFLTKKDENIFMVLPNEILEHTLSILKKYALFSKINFSILNNDIYKVIAEFKENESQKFIISIEENLQNKQDFKTIKEWKILLIKNKYLELNLKNIGKYLPHELNIEKEIVSFRKGCFLGQEIIARMKYLGVKKKVLVSIKSLENITENYDILNKNAKKVGETIFYSENYALLIVNKKDLQENNLTINNKNFIIIN